MAHPGRQERHCAPVRSTERSPCWFGASWDPMNPALTRPQHAGSLAFNLVPSKGQAYGSSTHPNAHPRQLRRPGRRSAGFSWADRERGLSFFNQVPAEGQALVSDAQLVRNVTALARRHGCTGVLLMTDAPALVDMLREHSGLPVADQLV
jgi:hypothetical protein